MANAIGDNNLKALKRPNKNKKYNGNTFKDKNNKFKRLALLGKCPNRQPEVQIWLAKTNTKTCNIVMPPIY